MTNIMSPCLHRSTSKTFFPISLLCIVLHNCIFIYISLTGIVIVYLGVNSAQELIRCILVLETCFVLKDFFLLYLLLLLYILFLI